MDAPHEPVALTDHREDEVRVVLRQEVQRRLGGAVAAPGERPRADGDHGLDDVVPGPARVGAGITNTNSRSIWYSLISSTPASGRTLSATTNAVSPVAPSTAKCVHGVP